MKNWFARNFEVDRDGNGDCYAIKLFGLRMDFRQFYVEPDDKDKCWFLEFEVEEIMKYEKERNKRRKVKRPLPVFRKIPWIKTILKWHSIWYRSRIYIYSLVSGLLGFLIGVNF